MAVIIGSARIDENGKAHGGKAGDQTSSELSTQFWYKHSKGWVLLRPKSSLVAEKIASNMQAACSNSHIGYDQYQRDTLYSASKTYDFDTSQVKTNVETDCSALVRVCVQYAFNKNGIAVTVPNFRTPTESSVLMKTGQFDKYTEDKYTKKADYLKRGDILVTKVQGHTVVVLSDGSKAEVVYALGERILSKGLDGPDVVELQKLLLAVGQTLPKYGADGDFGNETVAAVKAFQVAADIDIDGIMDAKDIAVLKDIAANGFPETDVQNPADPTEPYMTNWVVATGSLNVRTGPSTNYSIKRKLAVGEALMYDGAVYGAWYAVHMQGKRYWVSSKISKIVVMEKPILDISKWNTIKDWSKVAKFASFIFIRAGYRSLISSGKLVVDPKFKASAAAANAAGIPWGGYFYGRAKTIAQGAEESRFMVAVADSYKPSVYAYDVETASNTFDAVQTFVRITETESGRPCGTYIGRKWSQVKADKLERSFQWSPYYNTGTKGPSWLMFHGKNPSHPHDYHQYSPSLYVLGASAGLDASHVNNDPKTTYKGRSVKYLISGGKED